MPPGDVKIFSLHDADHSGYNLSLILGEETVRMPDHNVEVIDIGLTVADSITLGLESEEYTRSKALPERLVPRLDETELAWFGGAAIAWKTDRKTGARKPSQWRCRRTELNAFTSPALIAYIEDALKRHGAAAKVVPPRPVLRHELRSAYESAVKARVEEIVARLADVSSITRDVQRVARRRASRTVGRGVVRERLESSREDPWRVVVGREAASQLQESGADIERLVAGMLKARLDKALSQNGDAA
jgi:hypothetical protein